MCTCTLKWLFIVIVQVVKDIELAGLVLALLLVDILILILQEGIDPVDVKTYNVSTKVGIASVKNIWLDHQSCFW